MGYGSAALLLVSLLVGVPSEVARLDPSHEPLRAEFESAEDRVRLVALLSPT